MELFRTLAVLAESPGPETARLAHLLELGRAPAPTEHTRLFLFELYPYASVYLGTHGMVGGEARDRIAGFWRAMGHTPPAEPDHLAVLLAGYAQLRDLEAQEAEADRRAAIHRARAAFLWEHMLSWLPVYLAKLGQIGSSFYRRWAVLLEEALAAEARDVGPPRSLPLHLREAPPPIQDPARVDPEELFRAVLTPVWSGIIVTRADLGRAGHQLGIGVRAGERLYALNGMFRQAPQRVLGWLEAEAALWGERHEAGQTIFGIVARHWTDRARAMTRLVRGLSLLLHGRFTNAESCCGGQREAALAEAGAFAAQAPPEGTTKEVAMPVAKLKEFLDRNKVKYITIRHSPAFTAQEIAASAHVSGREVAKTVMVKVDGKMAMAVLPASFHVDFDLLKEVLRAKSVQLATETEFQNLFPECEVGAMPPFGNLYGMETYVAESLSEDEQVAFNAGTHTELIKLPYRDFERLVKPKVLRFSIQNVV